jgi:hypothetical protein
LSTLGRVRSKPSGGGTHVGAETQILASLLPFKDYL